LSSTDHVNMFTRKSLLERLRQAQFSVMRIEPEGFFVPHTALHFWLNRHRIIKRSLDGIARTFPSCAAGLIAVAIRPR
jgi:hypothetical protein